MACGEPGSYEFTFGAASGDPVTWFAPVTPSSTPAPGARPDGTSGTGASWDGASAEPGPPYGTGAGPAFGAPGICGGADGALSGGQYGIRSRPHLDEDLRLRRVRDRLHQPEPDKRRQHRERRPRRQPRI